MAGAMGEMLVTSSADLNELLAHLEASGRFAFDTEFVSEATFQPVLCLMQVATRERLALLDPLEIGDLSGFWEMVQQPSIQVVMHAAGEDLRICLSLAGALPRQVFDVQLAAGLVGMSYPLALSNLVRQVLGIPMAGSETRTDWRRRPLTQAQLDYALDDVRHLLDLADQLTARLDQLGRREWALAEHADFVGSIARRASEERWRRLPGLHQLSRRSLEAARLLAEWREDEARRMNRPVRQVMRDDLLVAIAKRQPRSRRELEALRDFNRPALLSRGPDILAIVDRARAEPEAQLPELPPRWEEPPGVSTVTNLLAAALQECCAQNEVAAPLVASIADLKQLVRWQLDGRPDALRPEVLQGWRAELCGRRLLDVLEGRLALRVVDPASEFPVALEVVESQESAGA
jgi:ribonuclease D